MHMGMVISFPAVERTAKRSSGDKRMGSATVIILPVIRIERYVEEPAGGYEPQVASTPRRRRRRRATRS